jgi:hypothetical protein
MAGRYATPSELFHRDAETVIATAARLSVVRRQIVKVPEMGLSGS